MQRKTEFFGYYTMFNFLFKSIVLNVSMRHVNIVTRLRANSESR